MGSKLIAVDPGLILWTLLTFGILALLLARFAWKPLLQILEERERIVRESLEQARAARAEAEETLKRNQELLAGARRETAAILEQGKREAEALRAEILAGARRESLDLVEQGRRQIQFETKQAMEQLRARIADLAIQAAERLIVRSLDDRTHRQLLDEYVKSLAAQGQEERPR